MMLTFISPPIINLQATPYIQPPAIIRVAEPIPQPTLHFSQPERPHILLPGEKPNQPHKWSCENDFWHPLKCWRREI